MALIVDIHYKLLQDPSSSNTHAYHMWSDYQPRGEFSKSELYYRYELCYLRCQLGHTFFQLSIDKSHFEFPVCAGKSIYVHTVKCRMQRNAVYAICVCHVWKIGKKQKPET